MYFIICSSDIYGNFNVNTICKLCDGQYNVEYIGKDEILRLENGLSYVNNRVLPSNSQGGKFCVMFSTSVDCFKLAKKCRTKLVGESGEIAKTL